MASTNATSQPSPSEPENAKQSLRAGWEYEFHDPVDPTLAFFYTPRTLTLVGLFILIAGLVYCAFYLAGDDVVTNTKLGLGAAFFVLLLTGLLQFRDGPFIRPHPAFWRVVLAVSVAYEILLDKHNMRQLLRHVDPSLGVPLPEKSYAEDCAITPQTLWDQMDVFVLAHTLGWFAKSIILRDYWFCWILSVLFEVMEYSLQHQLPNFAECWWDHWVLDVLLTNWIGTYLGMKTCEYFAVKRSIEQFTPHSWTRFEWGTTKSFKNFMAVILLLYIQGGILNWILSANTCAQMDGDEGDEPPEAVALPALPQELIARVAHFSTTRTLSTMLLVSRSFFLIASAEWETRLPPLDPGTVLHGKATLSGGMVNLFGRVLQLGRRPYSLPLAQIEFLEKQVTSVEPRPGGLRSLREMPQRQWLRTNLGRKLWVARSFDGGVKLRILTDFAVYGTSLPRAVIHLSPWNGGACEVFEILPLRGHGGK
ncbi:hypothetical protein HDU96_000934 [Phlyctochytrium bullatum]|nr:hypothetical protein HDU96_000934 [Phlyctochytrium bullatum]